MNLPTLAKHFRLIPGHDGFRPAHIFPTAGLCLALAGVPPIARSAEAAQTAEPAVVDLPETRLRDETPREADILELRPGDNLGAGSSAGELLRGEPGMAYLSNGPVTGLIQHRGMFGDRLNTKVNGQSIQPGGPNWMDAPIHYAPPGQLESIEVHRGIAPVSAGPEAPGGVVDLTTRSSEFTTSEEWETGGHLNTRLQSNGDGFAAGALGSVANQRHRFHALGGHTRGNDRRFGDSGNETIDATEHEKSYAGFGYGVRLGTGEISVNYRRHETNEAGNPSLPLDTVFIDSDLANVEYLAEFGAYALSAALHYQAVDHRMDNVTLRPTPDFFTPPGGAPPPVQMAFGGTDERIIDAESDTLSGSLELERATWNGDLRLGLEFESSEHDVSVSDPSSPFFATPFEDVERDRAGFFTEWSGPITDAWELTTGVRLSRVETDAGAVTAPPLPPARALGAAFNDADRDKGDTLFDWAVQLERPLGEAWTLGLGAARKTRAPSYIERYAWIPIESTAGLADGNNHVGQLGLDPEISREVELSLEWSDTDSYFAPRVFYRYVDDYIQGVPVPDSEMALRTVSTVNGDPTPLRYDNVEARFYGADLAFGHRFDDHWRIDGTLSFVRGERDDIDDDLFRIAPLNGRFRITYQREEWSLAAETLWTADQTKVAETNDEPDSDGYAILNLLYRQQLREGLDLRVGVENVFDTFYQDHLAGFNRVGNSDVGGGTAPPATERNRLPGTGRNFILSLDYAW